MADEAKTQTTEKPASETTSTTTAPAAVAPEADPSQTGLTRVSVDIHAKPAELVAGKFKDQAAFEGGIRELYKARGIPLAEGRELIGEKGRWSSVAEAEAEYKVIAGNKLQAEPDSPLSDEDDLTGVLKKSGIEVSAFSEAWLKDKKIDDKHFEAIKKTWPGVTRKLAEELVASIYESQQVKAAEIIRFQAQAKTRAYELAGGKEQWEILRDTFLPGLPKPQKDDLNRRLENPDLYEGAIEELDRLYKKTYGGSVPMVMGSSVPNGLAPISTTAELIAVNAARRKGDKVAEARFRAMSPEQLQALQ